ncbi:MAG: ornithine cyclodeaminase family protein [Planctomycetes bacterium]|nr:ornithine cyclodeaminase family protein [Planctomycetota bacterium]
MGVLLLTEDEVCQLLTMDDALEAVEQGLRKMALDEAFNMPRSRVQTDHAMLHVMSAAAKSLGVMGYKAYATSRKGACFLVGLHDGKSGALLALIQADYLGQVRTGAASGVATKYMARPDATTVGIYGSGKQARTQVQAVCKVRKISRVHVYSPSEEHRHRFAEEMSRLCETEVVAVAHPELAARNMDIVITATASREPVLHASWIAEGTHINAIGSNFLGKAELDAETVRRCNLIVVDSRDQARLEAGDFTQPLEAGFLRWSEMRELGQIVVGRYNGRPHQQDITLFKSLGIAVEDIAVAAKVYARAQAAGAGRTIDW